MAKTKQEGSRDGQKQERGKQRIIAILIFHHCGFCAFCSAKCGFANTHTLSTRTHSHFDNISCARALHLYQRPHHAGIDFCSWQHENRENFMMSVSLWFYLAPALLWGECACCVCRLFPAQGVATVCWWDTCLVYSGDWQMSRLAVSSAHLIENAVICSSQMFMGRTSEGRREGEKYFWSVVAGLLSVFTILCGIFVRIGWRWELFGQSCCFAAPKIMKPLNISGSTDREEANQCQWVWLLKEYWPLVENCNKWLIQYQEWYTEKKEERKNDWVACKRQLTQIFTHNHRMRTQL